ncbi:MAG TPA: VOC family protein [Tepidisphaeraceae bacterium]|jgi:catechol 2,3-dioxygenase-like lactoylglutathione lyase family enzyme|nr:VOC family protein [Tepidisphaeraceae bacterium]
MLRGIDRVILRVPALESAVRYYRDVLGLQLLKQDARLANFRLADGQTELVIHNDPDLPAEAVYYLVDNVRDLYKRRATLKLQFISAPSATARGYRATVKDPFGTVILLLDRSVESSGGNTVEDAKPAGALFAGVEQRSPVKREALIKAYIRVGLTADDLPYTPHFESVYSEYAAAQGDPKPTRSEVWRHILNLRKGGNLPKLGEARSRPPELSPEDRGKLKEMLGADIGKRDRLPYTNRFDSLVDEFNRTQQRPLSPHLVWRLVAMLAK